MLMVLGDRLGLELLVLVMLLMLIIVMSDDDADGKKMSKCST